MLKKDKILKKNIENLKPIYLVYGEENYLLDEFKNDFVKKFVDDEIKDFNLTYIKEDETENFKKTLINSINTVPILADKRFILVKCTELFTKKTSLDKALIKTFHNFPDSTILLIIINKKINKDLKIFEEIKKIGEIINLSPPRYNKLDEWISNKFKEKEKKIDKKSTKFLEHMFNNKLERLDSEIEKIATCFYEKEFIQYKDIKKIISKDRLLKQNIIFDFVDALSSKEKGKAIRILNEMIDEGEPPLAILSMIVRQIRLLLSVKELKRKGTTTEKTAKILGEHPYPIKKCYRFSNNFTEEELEILLERVLEANLDIVTGKYDDNKMALEMTLLEI